MRKTITLFVTLSVFALGCAAPGVTHAQTAKPESQATPAPPDDETRARAAEAMKGLRNRVLTAPPEEIGFAEEPSKLKVWIVLMEMARPGGVATLVSFHDGTASLYTSTGGGILGGYSAREEARKFVAEAEKHLARMKRAESYPYPEPGRIKFYVRTPDGVYAADVDEKQLVGGSLALTPLFVAANDVLTKLREAYERRQSGAGQ